MPTAGKSTDTVGKSKLECLTEELIEQAFEKARDDSNLADGRLVRVTEAYYEKALNFIRQSFMKDEPVEKALGMEWCQEAESLFMDIFRHNLSIILIDENSGDVMGMQGITTAKKGVYLEGEQFKDDAVKNECIFYDCIADKAQFFEYYDVNEGFYFLALGVGEKYRRQGLASKLMNFALIFLKHFQLECVCVKGEGTSNYSKKVFEKNGFEVLYEQVYAEYIVDGKVVVSDTGEHKSIKLYGKRL